MEKKTKKKNEENEWRIYQSKQEEQKKNSFPTRFSHTDFSVDLDWIINGELNVEVCLPKS